MPHFELVLLVTGTVSSTDATLGKTASWEQIVPSLLVGTGRISFR